MSGDRTAAGRTHSESAQALPDNLIYGRNPVLEALKSGRELEKVLLVRGEITGSLKEIMARARSRGLVVQQVDRARLDGIVPHHQGVVAYASAARYSTVDDILKVARDRGEAPFLVVLDGVTDPHNVGAIARTALCAGAHGMIVAARRAAGLTPAAVKVSAGALEYLPTARVANIGQALDGLKKEGLWVFGAAMSGQSYTQTDFSGPVALVIGEEGDGISRLVLEKCDHVVSIPLRGPLDSLNASCAAAVLLYEVARTRGAL